MSNVPVLTETDFFDPWERAENTEENLEREAERADYIRQQLRDALIDDYYKEH